jgi:hypothetical protein
MTRSAFMALYDSRLSDSNRHLHDKLPIALFDGGDGSLKPDTTSEKPRSRRILYLKTLDTLA